MGWFSDLFNRKPYGPDTAFNCNVPMPKVKDCKEDQSGVILPGGYVYVPPKDISEPVYAIVKAMQERPSSFKLVKKEFKETPYTGITIFTVVDVKTSQTITVDYMVQYLGSFHGRYIYSWSWLTQDEGELLCSTFRDIYKNKTNRKKNMQRAAMKAIYK